MAKKYPLGMDAERQLEVHLYHLKKRFGIDNLNDILGELIVWARHYNLNKQQVLGAIERDSGIRRRKEWSSLARGGRPNEVQKRVAKICELLEKEHFSWAEAELERAKEELSRTSFWKIKKKIKEKYPTRYLKALE